MKERTRYFGKTIDEHISDETCWLCGKTVDPSQGIDGSTGAHWECSRKLRVDAKDAIEKMDVLIANAKKQARRF